LQARVEAVYERWEKDVLTLETQRAMDGLKHVYDELEQPTQLEDAVKKMAAAKTAEVMKNISKTANNNASVVSWSPEYVQPSHIQTLWENL